MTNDSNLAVRRLPVWRIGLWSTIAALLLLPLVAMQFTREVAWTSTDFLAAGILLIGGGLGLELVFWQVASKRTRLILVAVVLAVVALVWAQGAVGIV